MKKTKIKRKKKKKVVQQENNIYFNARQICAYIVSKSPATKEQNLENASAIKHNDEMDSMISSPNIVILLQQK